MPQPLRRVLGLCVGLLAAVTLAAQASAQPLACGELITHDIVLQTDLHCTDEQTPALTIGASGVTLDLNGHAVSSNAFDGAIVNHGQDHVTIENGSVDSFAGVVLSEADHNRLSGLRLARGFYRAITLSDSDHNGIVGNHMRGGGVVGLSEGSDRNVVADNEFSGTYGPGVILEDSARNRILANRIDVMAAPILLIGSSRNSVTANRVRSAYDGITLRASDRNTLSRNNVSPTYPQYPGGPSGFAITDGSSHNRLVRNAASGKAVGIELDAGRSNLLLRNVAILNQDDGVLVGSAARRSTLRRNRASDNGDDGIDVRDRAARLFLNSANGNGDLGIEAVEGVFARGNTASGNGNPLQCLNVVCR